MPQTRVMVEEPTVQMKPISGVPFLNTLVIIASKFTHMQPGIIFLFERGSVCQLLSIDTLGKFDLEHVS